MYICIYIYIYICIYIYIYNQVITKKIYRNKVYIQLSEVLIKFDQVKTYIELLKI